MKTILKYGVASGVVPGSGEACKRPYLTAQTVYDSAAIVEYAINAGYVRGQRHDLIGILNGCMEAIKALICAGVTVDLDSWLRFYLTLTGQVGDSLELTSANDIRFRVTTLKDLKVSMDDFAFQLVDEGERIRVDRLSSPNGKVGEWIKTKALIANGTGLSFNSAWNDRVVVTWLADEQVHSLEIVPTEQSKAYLRFDWPTELAEIAAGTVVSVEFRLHGGEGLAEQVSTKMVTLVAA